MVTSVQTKAGEYEWLTYKQVHELVLKIGNSMCSLGYGTVSFFKFDFVRCSVNFGAYICYMYWVFREKNVGFMVLIVLSGSLAWR